MLRPLLLHVSALNDAEYTTYTASICDIVKPFNHLTTEYNELSVGVPELQAWVRGRYPSLATSTLDSVRRSGDICTDLSLT